MRYRLCFILALLPVLLTACGEPEDTGPGQPVAHRRDAFKTILKAFEPMGTQLRKDQYKPDDFLALAKRLNEVKEGPWPYFTPNSDYPPSRANSTLWAEPEKFETKRQAFLKAVEGLSAAAETRDKAKVRAAYESLHETCADCHKAYKKS